jgi:hypothetical protein
LTTTDLEAPSEAEINERLNDLLRRWHAHCLGYSPGKGYPSGDAVCRQAKSSSVWDGWNGAQDQAVEKKIMEGFDGVMWNIPNTDKQPYLTALQFQARNLYTGKQVWTSPRLPADQMERGVLLMEARNLLLRALTRAGLMS